MPKTKTTLGVILRRLKPDYPSEFLRASDQTACPYSPTAAEQAVVKQRWAELQEDITNHVTDKACVGAFSLQVGTARWNAEPEERNAVHVIRKACWPTSFTVGLEYESNPLHEDWAPCNVGREGKNCFWPSARKSTERLTSRSCGSILSRCQCDDFSLIV